MPQSSAKGTRVMSGPVSRFLGGSLPGTINPRQQGDAMKALDAYKASGTGTVLKDDAPEQMFKRYGPLESMARSNFVPQPLSQPESPAGAVGSVAAGVAGMASAGQKAATGPLAYDWPGAKSAAEPGTVSYDWSGAKPAVTTAPAAPAAKPAPVASGGSRVANGATTGATSGADITDAARQRLAESMAGQGERIVQTQDASLQNAWSSMSSEQRANTTRLRNAAVQMAKQGQWDRVPTELLEQTKATVPGYDQWASRKSMSPSSVAAEMDASRVREYLASHPDVTEDEAKKHIADRRARGGVNIVTDPRTGQQTEYAARPEARSLTEWGLHTGEMARQDESNKTRAYANSDEATRSISEKEKALANADARVKAYNRQLGETGRDEVTFNPEKGMKESDYEDRSKMVPASAQGRIRKLRQDAIDERAWLEQELKTLREQGGRSESTGTAFGKAAGEKKALAERVEQASNALALFGVDTKAPVNVKTQEDLARYLENKLKETRRAATGA